MGRASQPARTRVWEAETESTPSNLFSEKKDEHVVRAGKLSKTECVHIQTVCKLLYFFFYLHTSSQHCMKHVRSLLHDADVSCGGVRTLAVLYGVDEAVSEFAQ